MCIFIFKIVPNRIPIIQAKIEVINTTKCENWLYQDLTDQQFCAGKEEGGVDACQVSKCGNHATF